MSEDPSIAFRAELRKKALALRDAMPLSDRDAYSQIIRKKTIEYLDSISAKFIHCYIGFRSEVQTNGILQDILDRNIKIAVPIIQGDGSSQHMIQSSLENLDHLRVGKFGVPEPEDIKAISLEGLDAVIMPVVAFDGLGMRLGYGKGFYDKFLSSLTPYSKRIGLAFSLQELEEIPKFPHDELINIAITEQSKFFFE